MYKNAQPNQTDRLMQYLRQYLRHPSFLEGTRAREGGSMYSSSSPDSIVNQTDKGVLLLILLLLLQQCCD
jgi:hypothetical protein